MAEQKIIKLENVSKKYKDHIALSDCNLEIDKGKIYGIVGPNGAGKTTLFKIILNLITPSEGTIYIDGMKNPKEKDISFGTLIEMPYVDQSMTAYQNLKFMQILAGKRDDDRIDEILQMVGLADTGKKKVRKFSMGMKQRLGIAMAVINGPDVLILDEPMNGLDPEGIVEIRNVLLEINKKRGVTIMVSSHILGELDKLVTDYVFIKNGEVFLAESKTEIEKDMETKKIADFEEYYIKTIRAYE